MGAYFSSSLLDISVTTDALRLLNGQEDPKLKRLLQWHLVSTIAAARRYVENGAVIPEASRRSTVPNLLNSVEKARLYVVDSQLEARPPEGARGAELKPLENLEALRIWLSSQAT
jgi:hypothetical protein